MATGQGVNVLRWSALTFGVFYGFSHQSSLTSHAKAAKIDREYQHKESLIQQAKAEWLKKTLPPEKKTETGGVITNPDDKNFDLEAYLTMTAANSTK